MKKALALVLALVLALSLGVSAFALKLVELEPEAGEAPADIIDISEDALDPKDPTYKAYLIGAEGGTFYVQLEDTELRNIELSANGNVTAKLVDYDPEDYTGAKADWYVEHKGVRVDGTDNLGFKDYYTRFHKVYGKLADDVDFQTKPTGDYLWVNEDGESCGYVNALHINGLTVYGEFILDKIENGDSPAKALKAALSNWADLEADLEALGIVGVEAETEFDNTTYEFNKALADALNDEFDTSRFNAVNENVDDIYVVAITVGENYSASYKTGSVKITAEEIERDPETGKIVDKTKVGVTLKIVSDVTIFEVEDVKSAGKYEDVLKVGEEGYSAYLRAGSYGHGKYDEWENRNEDNASVISTTAFKALRNAEDGIMVESDGLLVTIEEIAASQKGVNFSASGVDFYNAKGRATNGDDVAYVGFGFYGDQVIASDFTVTANLGVTAYELRERFSLEMEEEDVVTYYITENDEVVGKFTVDYANDEIDEELELEIARSAGSTLGQYKITVEAPAAPEQGGEENPNTGAESVLGVALAMAVVSVAAAAAVSLKK